MAIKCPKCQAENPDTQRFCGDCGTELPPSPPTPPSQPTPPFHSAPSSPAHERPARVTETLETAREELTTGSLFAGRYQIIEELGHGGMGRVYRVHDTKIGEKIALKLIRPEAGLDKKTVERFSQRAQARPQDPPPERLPDVRPGRGQGTRYITMEYVHGEDLKQLIRKVGRLSPGQAVGIARQVATGWTKPTSWGSSTGTSNPTTS